MDLEELYQPRSLGAAVRDFDLPSCEFDDEFEDDESGLYADELDGEF